MILAALYVSSIGQKSIPRVPNPTPDGIPMRLRLPRVSYVFTWTKVYQSLSQIAGLVSWRFCKSQSFGKALLHLDLILAGNGWPASYRFDSSVVFFLPCGTTPSSCAQYCVFLLLYVSFSAGWVHWRCQRVFFFLRGTHWSWYPCVGSSWWEILDRAMFQNSLHSMLLRGHFSGKEVNLYLMIYLMQVQGEFHVHLELSLDRRWNQAIPNIFDTYLIISCHINMLSFLTISYHISS